MSYSYINRLEVLKDSDEESIKTLVNSLKSFRYTIIIVLNYQYSRKPVVNFIYLKQVHGNGLHTN